jgi:hypothetical protein
MALVLTITLQKELPALAAYTKASPGKALARESDKLDSAARVCGVTAITSLLSESPAALIEQMKAEGFDPTKMRLPPEQWFGASEGLKTIRGLSAHVTANLNNFKQPNAILRDLKAAETLLLEAESQTVPFHFTKTTV